MNIDVALRARLNALVDSFRPGGNLAPHCNDLLRAVDEVRKRFGAGQASLATVDRVERALQEFRRGTGVPSRRQAFILSHALASKLPALQGKAILDDAWCSNHLLGFWEEAGRTQQLKPAHWRGLFHCYLQAESGQIPRLRALLNATLPLLEKRYQEAPSWLAAALRHRRLFTDQPVEHYAARFLGGDTQELEDLRDHVDVPPASWFWKALTTALAQAVARFTQADMQAHVKRLMAFCESVPGARDEMLKACLERWCALARAERFETLLEISLRHWGSPQLQRNALWSMVTTPAKQMVCGWLAQEDLEDFYELCKDDGDVDERRLEFWLCFKEQMSYTMILLGTELRHSQVRDVKAFIARKGERVGHLTRAQPGNNAILMCIGDWLFVEFSKTGHACFGLPMSEKRIELGKQRYVQDALKNRGGRHLRLIHNGSWEHEFLAALNRLRIHPDQGAEPLNATRGARRGTSARRGRTIPLQRERLNDPDRDALIKKLNTLGVSVADNRMLGGNVWVHVDASSPLASKLRELGMKYKEERGFFL